MPFDELSGDPDGCCVFRDIAKHDGVGADLAVVSDSHATQNFCSCANVDVSLQDGNASTRAGSSDGDLLKNQTVWTNHGIRMDHDSVGVRDQQPSGNFAIERNVGARNHAPQAMRCDPTAAHHRRKHSAAVTPELVLANRSQQSAPRIPKARGRFARPIGNLGRDRGAIDRRFVAHRGVDWRGACRWRTVSLQGAASRPIGSFRGWRLATMKGAPCIFFHEFANVRADFVLLGGSAVGADNQDEMPTTSTAAC